MRQAFKWPGFTLVALGIAVFPFVIWLPGPWGVMSLLMIMIGCVLLVLSLRGTGLVVPDVSGEGSVEDEQSSKDDDKPPA